MISGNGRHRRPRQAPALLVAAGVTGSAIAIPLLGAASASAADGTTWDRVADCESGGSWSANTGNGYFGGLQMSQEDWDKYGGGQYATSPDEASRSQQIAVAEKILADQGTKRWATCALLYGLSSDSSSVHVDTGVSKDGSSQSGDSSDSSDSSGSSGSDGLLGSLLSPGETSGSDSGGDSGSRGESSASDSASHASPSDSHSPRGDAAVGDGSTDSDNAGKSGKSSSSGAKSEARTGDGSPSVSRGAEESDNAWRSGSTWSLVDTGSVGGGRHRGVSAEESGTSDAKGVNAHSAGRHAYTVREGDSLASIADSLDVDGGWRALYAGNKKVIGDDPSHIAPGQTLHFDS
ncbi:transglycosylase family protein [Streptomyces sp. V3I7]|uniref:LysM peptidoglycan-binding domain-containing protein n=1 Tax=Streptomyces sp. V3I7 TaxID=3042278 RepID=UPI0027872144|nr:transglycosylase family protein [Streptomyces sp. V3I7]MDQ0991331.1 hypothetical protein [Streptomyces sp. V3I7]